MFAGNVAGCLLISSTQAGYFGESYYSLIEGYTELIALAFDRQEFYTPEQIALGVLPSYEVQKSSFSGFRQRTIDLMRQASINRHPVTALEAEQLAWQQLEQELLQSPFR
jgi:ABC-type phosphate/phosphonate transport system permease subunit